MGAKKKAESLSAGILGVRLGTEDMARLDALAERMPIATKHGIARIAIRLGLDAIEANPMVLLGEKPKTKRGK
jgi:hypothetical protein